MSIAWRRCAPRRSRRSTRPLAPRATVGTAEASALAISANDVLFTANSGGGDAYDLTTGSHLTSLVAGGSTEGGLGKATLLLADDYLYLFGAATGFHVYDVSSLTAVPAPSMHALLAGVGALGVAVLRRRCVAAGVPPAEY